jgi:hypothetical protein
VDSDITVAMKTCSKCKQEKSLFDFNKHSSNKDGLQYQCKSCRKVACSTSFKKISNEQKEKRNQASSLWRDSNPEKRKEYAKQYASKNRAKLTSIERKRQASKLKRTPAWLTAFDKLHMECLYQVAAMRTRESGQEWHVDHILPLQGKTVSGLHVPSNLRVIPAVENLRKYNIYGV